MRRKLNEDFQGLKINKTDTTPDVFLNFDKPKRTRKKKPKIELQQIPQQIVEVTPLEELQYQQTVKQIVEQKEQKQIVEQKEVAKDIIKNVSKRKRKTKEKIQAVQQTLNVEQVKELEDFVVTEQEIEVITETLEETNNVDLTNVDVPELVEEITDSVEDLPGFEGDINDFEITPIPIEKKDKSGYFKTKVNIKKSNIPQLINEVASYIKQQSRGIIKPRVVDMRVIANTNKTQLRNSSLKLTLATVVFKPDHTKLKVNKGTRFMISVPDDFKSTGNLLVYLQESRAKTIIELSPKDFSSTKEMVNFVGDRIAEFYYVGYNITLQKLRLLGKENPLMRVITNAVKTQDYKAKPYSTEDNHIYMVDFITKGIENQWLTVRIQELPTQGFYNILGINTVTGKEYVLNSEPKTLAWLEQNIIDVLSKSFNRDWSNELNKDGDTDSIYYLLNKISHKKLRDAVLVIYNTFEDEPELGIVIDKVLSKNDMKRLQKTDYDAESVIGKTNNCNWFILTYLAYQIIGGDSRKGRDYITREQYYDKYNVSDKRKYQEREKTILRKEGEERNYNARIYVFQLEYNVNGKTNIYRSKSFMDILEQTKFLTTPNINVESIIK